MISMIILMVLYKLGTERLAYLQAPMRSDNKDRILIRHMGVRKTAPNTRGITRNRIGPLRVILRVF